jgi:hypothetical protein
LTNGDIQIFFDKLLRLAGITPNGLPDNETNEYQLVKALRSAVCSKYVKTFVSDLDGDVVSITRAELVAAFGINGDFSKGVGATNNVLVDFHISVAIQVNGSGDWLIYPANSQSSASIPVSVDSSTGDIEISLDLAPTTNSNVRVVIIG